MIIRILAFCLMIVALAWAAIVGGDDNYLPPHQT